MTLEHNVATLHRAGILLGTGTDAGVTGTYHGWATLRELKLLVQSGLTPIEAITAATRNSAKAVGLDQDRGTIQAGKRADLIIVDANPLDNISNIRKIRFVVTQGRLFDCAKLWESVGFKP